MNASTTRRKVQKKCKIRGYNLKVEALDEILSFVSRFEGPDEDGAIDLLLDELEHESRNLSLSLSVFSYNNISLISIRFSEF